MASMLVRAATAPGKRNRDAKAATTSPEADSSVTAEVLSSDVEIIECTPVSSAAVVTSRRQSSGKRSGDGNGMPSTMPSAARQSGIVTAEAQVLPTGSLRRAPVSVKRRLIPVTSLATTLERHSPTCYTIHLPRVNNEPSSATLYTQLDPALTVDAALFEDLWNMHPPTYGSIKMFGKTILTPRWHAVYGSREYKFSGVSHAAHAIPPAGADGRPHYFQRLIDWVARDSGHSGYDSLLVNWYGDQSHYMGVHTDDESTLVPNAAIYSFSYGAARDFIIHDRKDLKQQHTVRLPNNSLLVMREAMQRHYKHSVPKAKHLSGRRINITLRHFKL